MKTGMIISAALHLLAVLAMIFGLPFAWAPARVQDTPILVELVKIGDLTRSQEPPKPKLKPEPPKPKVKPKAKPKAAKPPPPAPRQKASLPPPPPKRPELAPPNIKRKPKKEPVKIEVPPKVSFAAAPTPPAKPVRKKRKDFDTNRLHALLDKSADKPEKSLSEKLAKLKEAAPQPAPPKISDLPLTMTEIDAIRYQIEQCWSVPGGARDARDLIVRIKVFLHPDGSLAQAPQIIDDNGRMGEAFYRTAAESARRAVLTCAPFKSLPVGKYNSWREITLTFNPREMLGG